MCKNFEIKSRGIQAAGGSLMVVGVFGVIPGMWLPAIGRTVPAVNPKSVSVLIDNNL
jgi:hypothetical protein